MSRKKLYNTILLACGLGYVWLFYNLATHYNNINGITACAIKKITNIPCPSCGATRAVITLFKGNFYQSVCVNPFGIIIVLIMILAPLIILYDYIFSKQLMLNIYVAIENIIKKPPVAILLIVLVLANWAWNIIKGY